MFSSKTEGLIFAVVLGCCGMLQGADEPIRWRLNKTTIMVGGCCTLTIDDPRANLRSIELVVDGQSMGTLNWFGPHLADREAQHVLLWARVGPVSEGPGPDDMRRMAPLFGAPGEFVIGLRGPRVEENAHTASVESLPAEAQPSLELLYPVMPPEKAPPLDAVFWHRLIWLGGESRDLVRMRDQVSFDTDVPKILAHPDWRHVLPSILQYYEVVCALELMGQEASPDAVLSQLGSVSPRVGESAAPTEAGSPFVQTMLMKADHKRGQIERILEHRRSSQKR